MSKNGSLKWIGLGAAGAVGYYFYKAGGDPKLAEKKAEADAARISSAVRDNIPGQAKKLQKEGEAGFESAKSHLKSFGSDLKAEAHKADAKIEQYSADAKAKLEKTSRDVHASATQAVDSFDKNVNEGAAKAKSGISSWFGSK